MSSSSNQKSSTKKRWRSTPRCQGGTKDICGNPKCKICLPFSFASHQRAKDWDPVKNGDEKSIDYNLHSNKKIWFCCDICNHSFEAILRDITRGQWCPFCCPCPRKLCEDYLCGFCYGKSFASHIMAQLWHPTANGSLTPRDYLLHSGQKACFLCPKCHHKFESPVYIIVNGCDCQFCSNHQLCEDENCEFCFKASFASHERAKFWHPDEKKNENKRPRDYFKSSGKKVWFQCGDCNFEFETTLNHIARGRWCAHCSTRRSERLAVEIIEQFTQQKFVKIRPDWLSGLELDAFCELLQLGMEYNGIQHEEYVPHFHRNGIIDFEKQMERDATKLQRCKDRNVILIVVPSVYSFSNEDKMRAFIKSELIRCNIPIIN